MFKKDKDASKLEELNNLKTPLSSKKSSENDLLLFFVGIVLLAAGLFMLSRRVMVHSSWYIWRLGGFDLSSGVVTIPLIIGFIWYFFNPKSIFPKMLILLGSIFIILTIILSIRINFVPTSLFEYILIFAMAGAGSGLLLRTVFKNNKDNDNR